MEYGSKRVTELVELLNTKPAALISHLKQDIIFVGFEKDESTKWAYDRVERCRRDGWKSWHLINDLQSISGISPEQISSVVETIYRFAANESKDDIAAFFMSRVIRRSSWVI